MKITLPKNFLYQFLLFINVFVPYLNIYELTFAVWSLTALFTIQNKLSVEIIKHVSCYIIILIIAFISLFRYFSTYSGN